MTRIDVMLIKPHADTLRIDFDQLAEGVLQAPADGNRAAESGIVGGEFFSSHRAGRVDAGPGFIDDYIRQVRGRLGQVGARGVTIENGEWSFCPFASRSALESWVSHFALHRLFRYSGRAQSPSIAGRFP